MIRQFPDEQPCHKHIKWLAGELRRAQPGFKERSLQCSTNRRGKRKHDERIGAAEASKQGYESIDHPFEVDGHGFPVASGEEMPQVLPHGV
jgi:hypothetical protein